MTIPPPTSGSRPILVSGGAGFIGSHLVEHLLTAGHSVVVVDDLSTGSLENLRQVATHPRLRIICSTLSACPELPELAATAGFVFHLAATVGVELVVKSALQVLESSFHETQVLLRAVAQGSAALLFTSSSEVYGKSDKPAFLETEDLLIGPPSQARWSYACAKLTDEFLALAYAREKNLPVTIVRLFNTVGPRQTGRYGMVLPRFIDAAKRNQTLKVFGDGRQTRCFCYVADVVAALAGLQQSGVARGGIFNIGGTEEISMFDLAREVIATLNSSSRIELLPYSEAYAPGFDDMRRRKPNVEKLQATLGFRPATTLRDIILLTAASSP